MTFGEWVQEFERWINPVGEYPDIVQRTTPSREQLRNLAEVYREEVADNVGVEVIYYVGDERRVRYRDALTGRYIQNPYKQLRGYE